VLLVLAAPATDMRFGMPDRNWWLPRWLDRLLPRLDVEGEAVAAGFTPPVGADRAHDEDVDRVPVS
jgi:uncharacterized membrane protein YdfJ with MMPL/SSD domain